MAGSELPCHGQCSRVLAMGVGDSAARSLLDEELEAVTETGLYDSKEAFLAHAVEVLLTARPDLGEAVACKLYEKGRVVHRTDGRVRGHIDREPQGGAPPPGNQPGVQREPRRDGGDGQAFPSHGRKIWQLSLTIILDTDFLSAFLKVERLHLSGP